MRLLSGILISSAITLVLSIGAIIMDVNEKNPFQVISNFLMKPFELQEGDNRQAVNDAAFGDEWGSTKQMIKNHEGKRLDVYEDTKGLPTVGYGHLVNPGDSLSVGDYITQEHADSLFNVDWDHHLKDAQGLVSPESWENMPSNQRSALIDLTYNMGPTKIRNEFPSMLQGFEEGWKTGDYSKAANNLKWVNPADTSAGHSQYWTDVGDRSQRIFDLIQGNTSVDLINQGY